MCLTLEFVDPLPYEKIHGANKLSPCSNDLLYCLLSLLLMQMYPGWSARDNYAVHKKRRKRKTKTVDGNKQSPTATSTGGGSTTEPDQDSHNTTNDNNDIDGKAGE